MKIQEIQSKFSI